LIFVEIVPWTDGGRKASARELPDAARGLDRGASVSPDVVLAAVVEGSVGRGSGLL